MLLDEAKLTLLGPLGRAKREYSNWGKISHILYAEDITEQKVLAILYLEIVTHNRPYYVSRIHARYNKLRMHRERKELKLWNRKKLPKNT